MKRVAVVGAPGTGKTQLAGELAGHFASAGDVVVAEGDPGGCDAVLLMGLDLPGTTQHADADARLREQLQRQRIAYQVVYGAGRQRLLSALSALESRGIQAGASLRPPGQAWNRNCEKCSDPECEHRLFRRLLD